MLLLLLVAGQYILHNNIVIMCVMYKQTSNRDNETEWDEDWTRKGLLHVVATWSATFANSVHCKFDARHLHFGWFVWFPCPITMCEQLFPNFTG